jgi:Na+/H+ antiporter NhaD/arsenite permease-like protein
MIMIRREFIYPAILLAVGLIGYSVAQLEPNQVASLTIFTALISGTLLFWRFRLAFALAGIAALMVFGLMTTETFIEFAGLDIILFLVGMMIVIGYLEDRHFFEYLLEKILKGVGNNPWKLVVILMLMSAMFAALVDEVTSILFMTATVLHLTSKLKINPIPFVMMIVFATNIGSSATVVGNPVGVLIALRAELSFIDFLRWATPISLVGLSIAIPFSLWYFSKDIRNLRQAMTTPIATNNGGNRVAAIADEGTTATIPGTDVPRKSVKIPWILFLGTIAGLVVHGPVEELLGLEKNVMLLGTALAAASVTLFINRTRARDLVERRVDWWTLSFFIFLFASVGTLQITGITTFVANGLIDISGGDDTRVFFLFTGVTGIMGALMDNVLAVATFIPVVNDMTDLGIYNYPLWWGLLFGATFFGNLTLIGSTANIVALGMLERQKLAHIPLLQWIKPGALVSVPTLLVAMLLLYLQIPLMPR